MQRALGSVAMLMLMGCAHGTLLPTMPGFVAPKKGKVAEVTVTIDPSLDEDWRSVYEQRDGSKVIAEAIIARLQQAGAYDRAGNLRLVITVTDFRLRSTANAFWNGFFAGIDMLDGRLEILQGSERPVEYAFKLSGTEDIYFKYSANARFDSLVSELATKIAEVIAPAEA